MRIEHVEVYGFRAALRGMRNPMESWGKSDSTFGEPYLTSGWDDEVVRVAERVRIGPEDLALACKLIRAGDSHCKFLRQIQVYWDITIPRMIWQELDTYKVATVRNSCSTMHKLGSRDLEPSDFEGYEECLDRPQLELVNLLGAAYRANRTNKNLHRLKLRLPESFLQKATYTFSYQTGIKMYFDRREHRMPEWSGDEGICMWITRLPYMRDFLEAMMQRHARQP